MVGPAEMVVVLDREAQPLATLLTGPGARPQHEQVADDAAGSASGWRESVAHTK